MYALLSRRRAHVPIEFCLRQSLRDYLLLSNQNAFLDVVTEFTDFNYELRFVAGLRQHFS